VEDSNYKKFRSTTTITPLGGASSER